MFFGKYNGAGGKQPMTHAHIHFEVTCHFPLFLRVWLV